MSDVRCIHNIPASICSACPPNGAYFDRYLAQARLDELQRQNVELAELRPALTAAQSRIERLERALLFAACTNAFFADGALRVVTGGQGDGQIISYPCDGTAPSILAAVENAMGDG